MAWKCNRHQNCPAERRRRSHYTNAVGQYVTAIVCADCHGLMVRETWPTGETRVHCEKCGRDYTQLSERRAAILQNWGGEFPKAELVS